MTRIFRITYELELEEVPDGDDATNVAQAIADTIQLESTYDVNEVNVLEAAELKPM